MSKPPKERNASSEAASTPVTPWGANGRNRAGSSPGSPQAAKPASPLTATRTTRTWARPDTFTPRRFKAVQAVTRATAPRGAGNPVAALR
jgi:hypothetical protein